MDKTKDITTLINDRQNIYDKIYMINNEHTLLENKITELNELIYKNCKHEWECEPRQIYERATYRCNICCSTK